MTITFTRDPRNAEFRKARRKANLYGRLFDLTKNSVMLEQFNDTMFDKHRHWRKRCWRILDAWCAEMETKLKNEWK